MERTFLENYSPSWSADSTRLFATASPTAKALFFYVQECGFFKTSSDYYTERENLNSFLLLYTTSGEGTLIYENESHRLGPGSLFFINCNKHHYYHCSGDSDWEFYWVHFNGVQAYGYYEESVKNGFLVPYFSDDTAESLLHSFVQITNSHRSTTAHTELLCSHQLNGILTTLLMELATFDSDGLREPDMISKTKQYIEHHFREPLTLDDLADIVLTNKFHLSHTFKKYVGIPINEYLINTRISYAKELLRFSQLSIEEIAYEIGMNQASYFIRAFKKRENVTPAAYRKAWRD